mgnify:CR=1 FL=1
MLISGASKQISSDFGMLKSCFFEYRERLTVLLPSERAFYSPWFTTWPLIDSERGPLAPGRATIADPLNSEIREYFFVSYLNKKIL